MANFIVQFQLETELFEEDILDRRFEIGRKIYNSLTNITLKRYNEMIKTRQYRDLVSKYRDKNSDKKQLSKELRDIRKRYGITEYAFHSDVKEMQKHFKENIDSFTAQKIATQLWKAYDKLIFGEGKEIHYKKYGEYNSLEGKSNNTGIRFKDDFLLWNGLKICVNIDYNNPYEAVAMRNDIAYCRIVRKFVRGKYKYYLQIVFRGITPSKVDRTTGKFKNELGKGDVGIDIGTQTVAISSETDVKIYELADRVQNIENEKRRIQRKMERSRRATNGDKFNDDGTIKKQGKKKVKWVWSKRYIKNRNKLREIYRKQADIRKQQHEITANRILLLGDKIYVETMSFKGLQRRSKKTEKNEEGKYKRKKRFGKSIANKAPAMFLNILNRKLESLGTKLNKIDTWSVRASQYNHIENCNKKKKLCERWNDIGGKKVQRDMYSAFVIMNVSDDLKRIDKEKSDKRFDNFMEMHDMEVERLIGGKKLSSIGI